MSASNSGINSIEVQGMITDNHFLVGAAKGSLKRLSTSFETKKKKLQSDLEKETDALKKEEQQNKLSDCEIILTAIASSAEKISKKAELMKNK